MFSTSDALSTSAVSAGMPAWRAARSARASAARAAFVRSRRIAIPATTSSCAVSQRGRKRRGIELGERALGLVDAPDQKQAADLEIARVRGVDAIAVRLERRARGVERLRGPAQIARDERDLGLGDDAPRARDGLSRTERARRASQQRLRAHEIAELRHRDASQRERRRVVAQRDALQRAERIARGERARRGGDQRVHSGIPSHLSLPPLRYPALTYRSARTHRAQHGRGTDHIDDRRRSTMTTHTIGTREEWLAARLELLAGREGAHATQRRAGAAASGTALGPHRQGLSLRHRRGERRAGGPLPGPLAAPRLPLHVRPRLRGGLPSCSAIADGFNGVTSISPTMT